MESTISKCNAYILNPSCPYCSKYWGQLSRRTAGGGDVMTICFGWKPANFTLLFTDVSFDFLDLIIVLSGELMFYSFICANIIIVNYEVKFGRMLSQRQQGFSSSFDYNNDFQCIFESGTTIRHRSTLQ